MLLDGLSGNDLLFALHAKAGKLEQDVTAWYHLASEIAARRPAYELAIGLLKHAAGLAEAQVAGETIESVRANRSLLDEPDPLLPVLNALGAALRSALRAAHAEYERAFTSEEENLAAHEAWAKLASSKQQAFLAAAGVSRRALPAVDSESALLAGLDACDLVSWRTHADVLSKRFAAARSAAIKEAEPKARAISLPSRTIRSTTDLEDWLAQAKAEIESALKDGPVIL
jgi:hypothetical protein